MLTLFSSSYLHIYLHEDPVPVIETHWQGFATGQEIRQALTQVIPLAQQYQVKGWVADDRLLGAVRPRDLEWIQQQVLLPLHRLGVRRFAHLESGDALNRLTIAAMYKRVEPEVDFEIQRFTELPQARAWAGSATL